MSGMASEQIETLIAAQKEIINATWNIERRAASGAGRSAADMTAIAAAQAELQARAEQMASRTGRGRGPIRFPQQVSPPRQLSGGAAVGRIRSRRGDHGDDAGHRSARGAADRRGAAARDGGAPGAAAGAGGSPPARGGAAGRRSMGGLGRQGQDLSALFDKELQRQQRTNYETRSQTETRADRQEQRERARQDPRSCAPAGRAEPPAARARQRSTPSAKS